MAEQAQIPGIDSDLRRVRRVVPSVRTESGTEAPELVLMIGLPSCGKTHTSRRITEAGDVLIEFDEYFYTQRGTDPSRYDWSSAALDAARAWNLSRIQAALDSGRRVIVDSDNSPHPYTRSYVSYALAKGYRVTFREPESPWWAEIRELLSDPERNVEKLRAWANKLTVLSRGTHRVPLSTFLRRMEKWNPQPSLEDLMEVEAS